MGLESNTGSAGGKPEYEPKRYRIAWKAKVTGATGHGEYMDAKAAELLLEEIKVEYPEIDQWLEPEEK